MATYRSPSRLPRQQRRGTIIRAELVGFEELRRRLLLFPKNMRKNAMRGGARAAAKFLAQRLKARLSAKNLDTAAGSVKHSARLFGDNRVVGKVEYGSPYNKTIGRGVNRKTFTKDPWYAHILEWGARQHEITPVRTKALKFGGRYIGKVSKHPGVKPGLYAQRTADQDMPAAMRTFEQYVERRVTRYWSTGR